MGGHSGGDKGTMKIGEGHGGTEVTEETEETEETKETKAAEAEAAMAGGRVGTRRSEPPPRLR